MEAQARTPWSHRLPAHFRIRPFRLRLGWEAAVFIGLALVALGLRLWELDGRTMHYDESLHLHYAWKLAVGEGYSHSPWMHGPFQVLLTAFIFKIFPDTDFTARLGYALFGAGVVGLPYFLRNYLGTKGAVLVAVLLTLSPALLYLSRFGRNEILMVFWAAALLTLMWRYINEDKDRYLYMAAAVLALAFATKETAYIVVVIFGAALFLMSLTEIVPWALGRLRLSDMRGAPAFLVLLVTLTLPQWAALSSIPLGLAGMELINEGVGEVGLPVLGPPFIAFPVIDISDALDYLIISVIVAVPVAVSIFARRTGLWKWLLPLMVLAGLGYAFAAFPNGSVGRDYLISFAVLAFALLVSIAFGVMWRWKVWLISAGIFYLIYIMFFTSMFGVFVQSHGYCPAEAGGFFGGVCSKLGGIYTGSWQSLGYWVAQQEVARGGQPWYYYFVIGSVYEFLPLIFGGAAVVYYLRKADLFGLALSFWAILTFIAYTIAGEKMPWLLANVTLPFIFLTGKFIGDLIEGVRWLRVLKSPSAALLVLAPLLLLAGFYLLNRYLNNGDLETWQDWVVLGGVIAVALASVILIRRARPGLGLTLAGMGAAVLMLGFTTFVSFRASYTYDDSPVEMLVFAQGSADLVETLEGLKNQEYLGVLDTDQKQVVNVDYEMWYPFNWYVRHEQKDGTLAFRCYKNESEDGYAPWCNPLEEPPTTKALLLVELHANRDLEHLSQYERSGPHKNLLWFPEGYRRPGENRRSEGIGTELKEDFNFVKDNIIRRGPWRDSLGYFLFRRLGSQWWKSEYSTFLFTDPPPPEETVPP